MSTSFQKIYFNRAVMNLKNGASSIEDRLPKNPTAMAPAALPIKATKSIGKPAATQGAVSARKASPAPVVSTIFCDKTGAS